MIIQNKCSNSIKTNKEYSLCILGEPVAKARARYAGGFAYTPTKTKNYEVLVRELFIAKYGSVMLDGYLQADIVAYFTIAKSTSKKKREKMISGEILPTKKPDLDNIAKVILDSLNQIAFVDDSHVAKLTVEKYYSENPRVEIVISEINKPNG